MKNTNEYAEPEIVGTKSRKRRAASTVGRAATGAAKKGGATFAKSTAGKFAAGFVLNQAVDRVGGFKRRVLLLLFMYTVGIILGIIGLFSLIGWALYALLPNGLATVLFAFILAPIVFAIYFAVVTLRGVIKHPLAKDIRNIR